MRYGNARNKPRAGVQMAWGHPLARDLYVHYLFNEGGGTRLNDVGGRALLHATLGSMDPATDWVGSDDGGCLDFDGTDDYATSNSGFSLNGAAAASYVVWFRIATAPTNEYLLASPNGAVTNGFDLRLDSDTVVRLFVNGTITSSSRTMTVPSFADSRWHQIAATYDGGVIRLYFDGVLIATGTAAFGTIQASVNELNICRFSSGLHAGPAARVSGVRVYKRALAAEEVRWLYADPYADVFRPPVWLRRDREHATLEIEAELDGVGNGWTNLTPDLLIRPSLKIDYGIPGAGPTDLVANTGHLVFALNNSEENSAGVLGYYSPHHPDCRPGFAKGIRIRCLFNNGSLVKFIGRLKSPDARPGRYLDRKVLCTVADWMDEAANAPVNVATQLGKRADEILPLVLVPMERQPVATAFEVGESVFPFATFSTPSVLGAIDQLCKSEYTRCYLRGNGTLVLENRATRLTPIPVASFHGSMQDLVVPSDSSKTKNKARVTAHPRDVGPNNQQVLYTKPSESNPPIAPGATMKITGRYTDPANRAAKVGGTDMQAPTATTDYLLNGAQNGSGADLTANLSVVASYWADRVEYELTNTGGTLGYVTKLQARGQALLDYSQPDAEEINQASIDDIGVSEVALNMPFQSDVAVAQAVAEFIVATWSTPGDNEPELEFTPRDADEFLVAIALEPGHPISVSEEVTGLSGVFYIQHVAIDVKEPDNLHTTFRWKTQRAQVADFATLDDADLGVLDVNAVLAPL